MFELMDGVISIVGGVVCYLIATGKLKTGKAQNDSANWLSRNEKLLKIAAPVLIIFGVFRLLQVALLL